MIRTPKLGITLMLVIGLLTGLELQSHAVPETFKREVGITSVAEEGVFPDTRGPSFYNFKEKSADNSLGPNLSDIITPGTDETEIQNITQLEEQLTKDTRSSTFDTALWTIGILITTFSSMLVLAYGIDKVSILPGLSILKILSLGRFDIHTTSVSTFLVSVMILMSFGVLLSIGWIKVIFNALWTFILSWSYFW